MRAGDRVELRSPREILATLDDRGRLDGVPFMPEMLMHFRSQFVVTARVERACDTVNYSGVVRLPDTVILDDLRCDGSGHDGCGARCRLYWKTAWLRPAGPRGPDEPESLPDDLDELRSVVVANTYDQSSGSDDRVYACQATELIRAGEPVSWYDTGSFVRELTSGNVRPWRWISGMASFVLHEVGLRLGITTRSYSPFAPGQLTGSGGTTQAPQGLAPGELVQIRSKVEVRGTLNEKSMLRGLSFDKEMVPYCGRTARVKAKVERFIDERTGRMVELTSDAYILDGVVCQSFRSDKRWFCSRAIYPWWREAWLERASETGRVEQPSPPS